MKITDYKGYEIRQPTSGGKAGKWRNVTSTVQVVHGQRLLKQIRFAVPKLGAFHAALAKAREWCDQHPILVQHFIVLDYSTARVYRSLPRCVTAMWQ